jgi:hypothetical protein
MPREVIVVEDSLFAAPLFESCNMYANFVIFQRHQQCLAGRQLSLSCKQVYLLVKQLGNPEGATFGSHFNFM